MFESMTDIESIRRRPAMYIGSVDGSGLLHLIWEVVANCLDDHLRGGCRTVSVEISEEGAVSVEDDGRGIPVHEVNGVPFAQLALVWFHDKPTMDGHAPHEHVGIHGVGLSPVNALSAWLTLDTLRDGRHHRQRYERGVPCAALEDVGPTERTGTKITFLHDAEIFSDTWIDPGAVATRLRELAYLLPSLTFSFSDRRKHTFHEPTGLRAMIARRRHGDTSIGAPLVVDELVDDVRVEAALEWRTHHWSSFIDSYANIHRTTEGGAHVRGLLNGLASGLRSVAGDRLRRRPLEKVRQIVKSQMQAVVCVRLNDPTYESPTKSRLETPRVEKIVASVMKRSFEEHLRKNPVLLARLVGA